MNIRRVWAVLLVRYTGIVVLRRKLLLRIEVRVVGIRIGIVYLRPGAWRIRLIVVVVVVVVVVVLVIRPPPAHIWRHALPCRQMTAVHHAGVGGRG